MTTQISKVKHFHMAYLLIQMLDSKFSFFCRNSTVIPVISESSWSQTLPLVLAFDVCSNPRPERVIWATPIYALRPGQAAPSEGDEEDEKEPSLVARQLRRSTTNVTCHRAELEIHGHAVPGEYVLMASNAHGARDAVIVLAAPDETSGAARTAAALSSLAVLLLCLTMVEDWRRS